MINLYLHEMRHYNLFMLHICAVTMCSEGSTNGIMKAIENGACDCFVKPFTENQVKYMWHHAVRKMMRGNKKQKINEQLGIEGSQIRARDDSNLRLNDVPSEKGDEDIPEPPRTKKTKKRKKTKKTKKERVVWSLELHEKFMNAVKELDASTSSTHSLPILVFIKSLMNLSVVYSNI
jgi:two-component response regulator ARR-B family